MSKTIKLVKSDESNNNIFLGLVDEEKKTVASLVHLRKSTLITDEQFGDLLQVIKFAIPEEAIKTIAEMPLTIQEGQEK